MYVLEAVTPPETLNPFAITIMGMPIAVFAVVMMVLLMITITLIYFWWNSHRLAKNKEESKGRVICEFMPEHGGKVYRELCESFKMEAKKVETKSRAMFMSDAYAKAPKGHALDAYYLLPEHDYLDVWPYNARPQQQVVLQKYYFVENDPCPKNPHDPSKWDADRYVRITSAIAKLSKDESNLQVLVSEMSGVWQNIADFVKALKLIPFILMAIGGLALITLFIGFMGFQTNQAIQAISKFLIGK